MTAVNSITDLARENDIAIITLDSPPVNALSETMREGLIAAIHAANADDQTRAIVLICNGRTFIAGADISEFGRVLMGPTFKAVQDAMDSVTKPIIAAIHGTALGGGLEVAMCAHYRIAVPSAKFGLPEVNLGLVPGAGGTQRLPRLVGVERALEMITGGQPIGAEEALSLGLIDEIVEEHDLRASAIDFARKIIGTNGGLHRTRDREDKIGLTRGQPIFARFRARSNFRGFEAPHEAIRCIEAAVRLPFDDGVAFERAVFEERKASPQSAAQRYAFFAERRAAKIPDLPDDVQILPISKVGIVGAGTMGGGIAMNFANAGIPVMLVEQQNDALQRGLAVVKKNYETSAKRGRFSPEEAARRFGLLTGSLALEDLADCDLIIEAVFERMDVKIDVFGKLDRIAKAGAILASNTSYLDINQIARATSRPDHVLGLHFFSPANVMKLLEIVRGENTAKSVIATAMTLAKRIGKVAVLVGVGPGFVGNRLLAQRTRETQKMLMEGAMPWDIDQVLAEFGMPMGPFQMSDLAGVDIGWTRSPAGSETPRDLLVESGRLGQKTSAGYYDYDENRKPVPSRVTQDLIAGLMARNDVAPRKISDQEILERSLYPMINEAANILAEGKALRASDIDVVWLKGYGWPAYRGGPTYYADTIGLATVLASVRKYGWTPSALLEKLVAEGKRFADLPA